VEDTSTSSASAADAILLAMCTAMPPTTYLLLTDERGWSTQQYVQWLATTLKAPLTDSDHADT